MSLLSYFTSYILRYANYGSDHTNFYSPKHFPKQTQTWNLSLERQGAHSFSSPQEIRKYILDHTVSKQGDVHASWVEENWVMSAGLVFAADTMVIYPFAHPCFSNICWGVFYVSFIFGKLAVWDFIGSWGRWMYFNSLNNGVNDWKNEKTP